MIGLVSTFIIMACSIYLIVEGNEKNDSTKFYGGANSDNPIYLFDVLSNTKYRYKRYGKGV